VGNENLAAALEVANAGMSDAAPAIKAPATDATPSTQPLAEPTTEGQPAATPAPTVDRITLEKLRERQATKQPQRREAQADPEYAEYQAWRAARSAMQSPGLDAKALQSNPIAALEAAGIDPTSLLNTLSKHAVTPDVASLESKIEARIASVLEENKALKNEVETIKQERARRAQDRDYASASQNFIEITKAADKFPNIARLDPETRVEFGSRIARDLRSEGIEFTLEEVAHLLETDLSKVSGMLGRDQQAPNGATPTPSQQATNGSAPKRAATITSDAAASTTSTPGRMTEKQRLSAAMEVARRG
jgi:hypothetical protein